MEITRNEIRTGLLVVTTLAVLVGVLLYLGSPGFFGAQKHLRVYFDNAGGIRAGSDVLLAGRRIGQVVQIYSPVPEFERPDPKYEVMVEVMVYRGARVFKGSRVVMVQTSLLGDPVVDFIGGSEANGEAEDGAYFEGGRQPGLNDAVPAVLAKLDPAVQELTTTLKSLRQTSNNLEGLTREGADLPLALGEFRKFGLHLNELSGPESSLRESLHHLEELTGENGRLAEILGNMDRLTDGESALAQTFKNAENFTSGLLKNKDVGASLKNIREATGELKASMRAVGPKLGVIGRNLEQASDTVKRQPWRLIWPTTKKYPDDPGRAGGRSGGRSGEGAVGRVAPRDLAAGGGASVKRGKSRN